MKKSYFTFAIIICIALALLAGKRSDTWIETDAGGTTFSISSTNADTSEEFNSGNKMTFGYSRYDTISGAGDDSLALRLYVDSYVGYFRGAKRWYAEDSLDIVAGDSTEGRWIFTNSSRSNSKKYRLRVAGIDSNSVDSANFLQIVGHIASLYD